MTVPPSRSGGAAARSDLPLEGAAGGPDDAGLLDASSSGFASAPHPGDAATDPSRFRRPDRPAPGAPPPSGRGSPGPGPFEAGAESALAGPVPTGLLAPRGIAEPLAALAAAFQANAEALRRSHELQADLGRALQRADRSEAMVQNTAALNDTFKGLTQVQRSLIHSVDEADRATRAHRWFLPTLVLASLVVVGAGLWLVVKRMEEVETDVIGRGDVVSQLASARREGEAAAREGLLASFATERKALEERLSDREEDLRLAKASLAAGEAKSRQLETELASAANEIQGARNDSLRARALEGELNQLRIDAAVKGPEAERLRIELDAEKRTVAELRRRLADVSMGRVPAVEGDGDAAERPPAADDAGAVRDRRSLEIGRGRLNSILQSSAAGRADYLQVTSLGSVAGTRVADVSAVRYGAAGKVMSTYKAKDLRITVDRSRRVVEFTFSDGTLDYGGSSLPFPGGTMTVIVAEGDQISSWLQSGLTFVGSR